ncbi:MAG: prepilin-type N-terminal cleavage/methylation domain-containing protein [Acidobacteria bacterium]|nr:prepilin-type N-terminal cleavage/methylation domain-containing protein [Acidobacteriota bacterium]
MRRRARAGFTLVEVLVAISLLSLLALGILTAMRVGLNALEHANLRLTANRRVMGAQRILEQQLAGLMPVVALCPAGLNQPPGRKLFFQGGPESMRLVSSFSLEDGLRGAPQVLEFQVARREDGRGYRLVVNELPYAGPRSLEAICDAPAVRTGPKSFVLADRLASCRFSYFHQPRWGGLPGWLPVWDQPDLPHGIRIDMTPLEEDLGRLRPVTLNVMLRISRLTTAFYHD